ncbi:hypothetical protein AB0F91_21225 [Amycolatopsis sp. NPDC023774]|uniref:hypothetical protein n=1 Tax=Amycolatopsis sp. NPDC023774 TaxID=3155015 RepID=UPI0033E917D0
MRWGSWLQVPAALVAAGYGVAELGGQQRLVERVPRRGRRARRGRRGDVRGVRCRTGGGGRWVLRAMTAVAWLIAIEGIVLMLNGHFFATSSLLLAAAQLRVARHDAEEWFDA